MGNSIIAYKLTLEVNFGNNVELNGASYLTAIENLKHIFIDFHEWHSDS